MDGGDAADPQSRLGACRSDQSYGRRADSQYTCRTPAVEAAIASGGADDWGVAPVLPAPSHNRTIVSGMLLPCPAVLYHGAVVGDVIVEAVPVAGLPVVPLLVLPTSPSSASAS